MIKDLVCEATDFSKWSFLGASVAGNIQRNYPIHLTDFIAFRAM